MYLVAALWVGQDGESKAAASERTGIFSDPSWYTSPTVVMVLIVLVSIVVGVIVGRGLSGKAGVIRAYLAGAFLMGVVLGYARLTVGG